MSFKKWLKRRKASGDEQMLVRNLIESLGRIVEKEKKKKKRRG